MDNRTGAKILIILNGLIFIWAIYINVWDIFHQVQITPARGILGIIVTIAAGFMHKNCAWWILEISFSKESK